MEQLNQSNQQITELEQKIDRLQHSLDRMNKIFLWTFIITAGLLILPLIGILFALPQLLSNLSGLR